MSQFKSSPSDQGPASASAANPQPPQSHYALRGPLADLMSVAEVARELKVGPQTVRNWFKRGLPRYRIGQRDWCSEAELVDFVRTDLKRTRE